MYNAPNMKNIIDSLNAFDVEPIGIADDVNDMLNELSSVRNDVAALRKEQKDFKVERAIADKVTTRRFHLSTALSVIAILISAISLFVSFFKR